MTDAPVPPGNPARTRAGAIPAGPAGVPATPAQSPPAGPERPGVTVATYDDYALAQRAVDYLSDNGFPVQHSRIVGTDLRLVETILGRLTTGRAALAGTASGAWFGLLIGLLIGLFGTSNWLAVLAAAVAIGAVWGAVFGATAHAATGGRRDFTSRSTLRAAHYSVVVDEEFAEAARQLVTRLTWRASGAG